MFRRRPITSAIFLNGTPASATAWKGPSSAPRSSRAGRYGPRRADVRRTSDRALRPPMRRGRCRVLTDQDRHGAMIATTMHRRPKPDDLS
jgi:hypothetical protein